MERKDVRNLAKKLSSVSGLDSDSVYAFLMAAGRYKSKNPTKLDFTAGDGIIFLTGERDNCYLERYTPQAVITRLLNGTSTPDAQAPNLSES